MLVVLLYPGVEEILKHLVSRGLGCQEGEVVTSLEVCSALTEIEHVQQSSAALNTNPFLDVVECLLIYW